MSDQLESLLRSTPLNDRQRAGLWDVFTTAKNPDDLAARLKSIEVPQELKAQMWDLKSQEPPSSPPLSFAGAQSIGAAPNGMIEALPTAGGMAGSLIGGGKSNPLAMLLSAAGGSVGEAYRQALTAMSGDWERVPPDVQGQIKAILAEGIKQGGLEGAGRYVMGPIAKLFGRALYRSALKPPVAVRQEHGAKEVANTLVEAGVPITRNEAGAAKVEKLLRESGQDTAQTLAAAEAAGAKPVTMRPVVQSLERTRGKVGERVVREGPQNEVRAMRDAALRENPRPIPLTQAQKMKQAEQDLALQAYKNEARGAPVNSVETSMHEDLARGLREAIERRVPGIRAKNKRTQDLIGALKAITAAEGRIANNNLVGMGDALALGTTGVGFAAGGAPGAALGIIQEVLTRPEIASRLGIALDRAGKPQVTPQILRALSEAVNQLTLETAGQ